MKIAKEVRKGEVIPEWYGVAWVRWEVDEAICYPMPLNLLIAAARAIAIWMRYGYRAVPYNARDAYAQGLRDGKRSNAELTGAPLAGRPVERVLYGAPPEL